MVWAMTELLLGTRIAKSDGQIHDQRLSGRR
jgi:hypothetical protein